MMPEYRQNPFCFSYPEGDDPSGSVFHTLAEGFLFVFFKRPVLKRQVLF